MKISYIRRKIFHLSYFLWLFKFWIFSFFSSFRFSSKLPKMELKGLSTSEKGSFLLQGKKKLVEGLHLVILNGWIIPVRRIFYKCSKTHFFILLFTQSSYMLRLSFQKPWTFSSLTFEQIKYDNAILVYYWLFIYHVLQTRIYGPKKSKNP